MNNYQETSKAQNMASPAERYRINAASCLRLAKSTDHDNRRRFEQIAELWLELAEQEGEQNSGSQSNHTARTLAA
jgi:hypothetical protein